MIPNERLARYPRGYLQMGRHRGPIDHLDRSDALFSAGPMVDLAMRKLCVGCLRERECEYVPILNEYVNRAGCAVEAGWEEPMCRDCRQDMPRYDWA